MEILVDSEVQVPEEAAPKKVVDALRRQLRQHDLPRLLQHDGSQRTLLNLLQTHEGSHRLPQGLLRRVTQTCRRHGVPYSVIDKRAMVSCPPLRSTLTLQAEQRDALHRLLQHDSGVLVALDEQDRVAVATELIARRQQRSLVLAESAESAQRWIEQLRGNLTLDPSQVVLQLGRGQDRDRLPAEARVGVSTYKAAGAGALHRASYGMVVFDELGSIDPVSLMRAVRATDARYLLGLAADAARADSLDEPLFLVLGGVVHQMRVRAPQKLRLRLRLQPTDFAFPYTGRAQYQALVAALARDERRNAAIVVDVSREARAGHPCLVLSERRDHLDALAGLLPDDLVVQQVTSAVRPAQRRTTVGRFEQGQVDVLLATSGIALELVRGPRVSRAFIAFPFSYARRLEQLVQQLLLPAPHKTSAVIYDYDDANITPLHRAFDKRQRLLQRLRRDAEREYQRWAQLPLIG